MNHLGPNHTAGLDSNTSNKSLVDLAMENFAVQRTLSRPASCTGIALHSGRKI